MFKKKLFLSFCILTLGVLLSIKSYKLELENVELKVQQQFNIEATQLASLIAEGYNKEIAKNLLLSNKLESQLSQADFLYYARNSFNKNPYIEKIYWAPYVEANQKTEYEAFAQQNGLAGYTIAELTEQTPPEYYLPVFYVYPEKGNERILGSDINHLPSMSQLIEASRQVNKPVSFVQHSEDKAQFIKISPIYVNKHFSGVIVFFKDINKFLNRIIAPIAKEVQFTIFDITSLNDKFNIYGKEYAENASFSFATEKKLDDGRMWQVYIYSNDEKYNPSFYKANVDLAIMLLVSFILSMYSFILSLKEKNLGKPFKKSPKKSSVKETKEKTCEELLVEDTEEETSIDEVVVTQAAQEIKEEKNERFLEGKRVFVVDKSQDSINDELEMLTTHGASTRSFSNSEELLSLIISHTEQQFDIILVEEEMPEISGFQLAKKIREHEAYSSATVIMTYDNDGEREYTKGVIDCYLKKPICSRDLYDSLSRIGSYHFEEYDFHCDATDGYMLFVSSTQIKKYRESLTGKYGNKITLVKTGVEALEKLDTNSYDIAVIVDDLEDLPVNELLDIISTKSPDVPIAILSNNEAKNHHTSNTLYIWKESSTDELLQNLDDFLNNKTDDKTDNEDAERSLESENEISTADNALLTDEIEADEPEPIEKKETSYDKYLKILEETPDEIEIKEGEHRVFIDYVQACGKSSDELKDLCKEYQSGLESTLTNLRVSIETNNETEMKGSLVLLNESSSEFSIIRLAKLLKQFAETMHNEDADLADLYLKIAEEARFISYDMDDYYTNQSDSS